MLVLSLFLSACERPFRIGPVEFADVYIQAGHEGRNSGATGAESSYGREIEWTPIVADEATGILREAGISVIRASADHHRLSRVKLAFSVHFDGSKKPCQSGAAIGYDDKTDQPAASAWKMFYAKRFPFQWMPDNFTDNLRRYYNFWFTSTSDAELILELGEITCREQAEWLKPRLKELGQIIAQFAMQRLYPDNFHAPKTALVFEYAQSGGP